MAFELDHFHLLAPDLYCRVSLDFLARDEAGLIFGSFFGMNVDTFENQPSIKWYFVSAVVLMVLGKLLNLTQ